MANPWLALVGYAVVLYLVAPRAEGHLGFLWGRAKNGRTPSTALLTASVVVTWIFAKSITNAANLGEKYGLAVGVAGVVGAWPPALALGSGANAALLGQNVFGLGACFLAYGVGLALGAVRVRSAETAAYLEPIALAEEP